MPVGMDYACNPPNCVFVADTTGCIALFGTPDATNATGQYVLSLEITAFSFLGPLVITYPDDLPTVSGTYFIDVFEEGSMDCDGQVINSSEDVNAINFSMQNQPNPFSDYTEIIVESRESKNVDFMILDFTGKIVQQKSIELHTGRNVLSLDCRQMSEGMYAYVIRDGQTMVSNKMLLKR